MTRGSAILNIEAVLADDDRRSVIVIGHCENVEDDLCQWFDLPIAIDPPNFLADEWVKAVRPGEWQILHG